MLITSACKGTMHKRASTGNAALRITVTARTTKGAVFSKYLFMAFPPWTFGHDSRLGPELSASSVRTASRNSVTPRAQPWLAAGRELRSRIPQTQYKGQSAARVDPEASAKLKKSTISTGMGNAEPRVAIKMDCRMPQLTGPAFEQSRWRGGRYAWWSWWQ